MGYSGAILKHKGKILFQLRDENGRNPNKWGIFGGGIKKGETPTEALIREVKEELGIKISKLDILKEYKIPFIDYHIFEINLNYSQKNLKLNEGKDMKFMTIKEFLNKKNSLWRVKIFFKLFRVS